MRRAMVLGLVIVAACGSETAAPPTGVPVPSAVTPPSGPTPLPPVPPLPPSPPTCPGTWAEMQTFDGDDCGGGLPARCTYAEGTCACDDGARRCRGAPEDSPADRAPAHLHCTPRPPARRADGCPRDEPPDGFACSGTPVTCGYGGPPDCCAVEVTCVEGAWVRGEEQCVP